MLESISIKSVQTDVFRLASQLQDVDFLRAEAFDDETVNEMLDLLASRNVSDNPEDLCDEVFRPKVHALVAMTLDPLSGEVVLNEKDAEGS